MLRSLAARRPVWVLGLGLALTSALPGCVAHASGELVADYPAEYVESVPVEIEYYPHTYYRGSPAYLVEGRWYYRTRNRWIVFREEPIELRDYRVRYAPAYVTPNRRHARAYDHQAERRERERERAGRVEARREVERRAERLRDERRAEEARRRQWRAQEQRRDHERRDRERAEEQRRQHERRDRERADQQRRFEQQREAERRADQDRRVAERRGRPARKRDRAHGDQRDLRDERDRRHYRND